MAELACLTLDRGDLVEHTVQRRRHQLVHLRRIVAFDEIRLVAVALEKVFELLPRNPRQDRRIGDLVAIQVQDR